MAIIQTTTRISREWLERKPKHELASVIMANLDRIDLFAQSDPCGQIGDIIRAAYTQGGKDADACWIEVLTEVQKIQREGGEYENITLAIAAKRELRRLRDGK